MAWQQVAPRPCAVGDRERELAAALPREGTDAGGPLACHTVVAAYPKPPAARQGSQEARAPAWVLRCWLTPSTAAEVPPEAGAGPPEPKRLAAVPGGIMVAFYVHWAILGRLLQEFHHRTT